MTVFNFLADRTSLDTANELLATPCFSRAEMLSYTEPRIDSGLFTNWVRRGFLNLNVQIAGGDAEQLKALADKLETNKAKGSRQRYTGGDVLKVITLSIVGQTGLPFALAKDIVRHVLRRAQYVLVNPTAEPEVLYISADAMGDHVLQFGEPGESPDAVWFTVIDIDRILFRLLKRIAATKSGEQIDAPPDGGAA